jgi:hypothetical protein
MVRDIAYTTTATATAASSSSTSTTTTRTAITTEQELSRFYFKRKRNISRSELFYMRESKSISLLHVVAMTN